MPNPEHDKAMPAPATTDCGAELQVLQDTAERYRKILNSARDGIIALRPDGMIDGVNPAIEKMFGYGEPELVGRSIKVLYENTPSDAEVAGFLTRVRGRGGETSSNEFGGKRTDGSVFLAEVSVTPMALSDGIHYVAIVRDITERKRVEEMKDQFVATVSHELRTPLTSIAGSLGLLAGGAAGQMPPTAVRLIKIAHENSERLVRLINDILDIEKIESGKLSLDMRALRLRSLVEQSIDATSGYAQTYDVGIRLEPGSEDATVVADADRLMQVMSNLLSNAIKFSPAREQVLVRIERLDASHRVTVSNAGEGIPEEFKARIFSRFAQADGSSTREKGGTGLGLNIVKEIIAKLGGSVGFESAEGKGASFYFELPAVPEANATDDNEVVICTPDAQLKKAVPANLKDRIKFAASPDELGSLIDTHRFSAIVLDLQLTDESRLEVIRLVREHPASAGTPIVVMSAGAAADAETLPVASVLQWLQKPAREEGTTPRAAQARSDTVPHILHVEDDEDILSLTAHAFGPGVVVVPAKSLAVAHAALRARDFDVVILDLDLGAESGLELLPELRQKNCPPVPVVIFSGGDVAPETVTSVDAVLTKSRVSLNQVVATVRSLIKAGRQNAV